jgi:hypothetical protein
MKNAKLNIFKESLRNGMIENFQKYGELVPMLFFLKDNTPIMGQIPNELLSCTEGKMILAAKIRNVCIEPNVFAAGIIMEANGVKFEENNELSKQVINGNISISELKEKQDIIVMIFSTPEEEVMLAYEVNCNDKTVGNMFGEEEMKQMGGTFSNFFSWNKN